MSSSSSLSSSSASNRKSETPKRSCEGGSSSNSNVAKKEKRNLEILETYKSTKKNKNIIIIARESHAVDIAGDMWMTFNKYAPVSVFDPETNRAVPMTKDIELEMEVTCRLPSGKIWRKVVTTGVLQGPGTVFWFKGVEFSAPGDYTITYTFPKATADALGYHVKPLVIPVHVNPPRKPATHIVTSPSNKKKRPPPAPPTPSSATNTRRASASSAGSSSTSTDVPTTTGSSTLVANSSTPRQRSSSRLSDAKLDASVAVSPVTSPRSRSHRLSSNSKMEDEMDKSAINSIPLSSSRKKRSRLSTAAEEEVEEYAGTAPAVAKADTSTVTSSSSRSNVAPHSASKKKRSGSLTVNVDKEKKTVEAEGDSKAVMSAESGAGEKNNDDDKDEDEEVERAHLERNVILRSLSSGEGGGPVVGLAALLPPALITALLDDAHDIHTRVFRRDQFQSKYGSKKFKKNASSGKLVDDLPPPERPVEVFLSADPALSTAVGPNWSVYKILHEPQFTEFMLSKTPSNRRKKHAGQLSYNVNTFLVAFESLCHCSPDNPVTDTDNPGAPAFVPLNGPILYHEERRSLETSGLLARILKSETEFLYHHCNARHLLRALILILLTSPKYEGASKDAQSDAEDREIEGEDLSANSFFLFAEKLVDYLNEHAFPLLYQN